MRYEDDKRFARLITTLAVATNAKDVDTPTIELYFRALMDVPIELLEAAVVPMVQSARFFPKVAEWRLACDKVLDARQAQLTAGNQLQLGGDVGDGRCPSCDDTGWVHFEQECAREWRCHQYVEGEEPAHTHTAVKRCDQCKGARDKKAEQDKRYGKPMWWEERD